MDIAKAETYVRNWLSVLDEDVYSNSIDQLKLIVQQWAKTGRTLASLHLLEDFNSIKSLTFRSEFLDRYDYPFSAEIFDAMDNMWSRLTHTDKRLEWSALFLRMFNDTTMLRNLAITNKKLKSLIQWSKSARNEIRFYLVCFSLQLAMEGIYDEIVRFVYATEQIMDGRKIDPVKIEHKDIKKIRCQIRTTQKVILGVWDSAHRIRNAIAHARFDYDEHDSKMRFIDVNPNKPTDVFDKSLTIEETQEIVNRIAVIHAAFNDLFALLQVYSALITPLDKQYG